MPLIAEIVERSGNTREEKYEDSEAHPRRWWATLLGVSQNTIFSAVLRGGLNEQEMPALHINMSPLRVTSVSSFPDLISGLGKIHLGNTQDDRFLQYPWAREAALNSSEFTIQVHGSRRRDGSRVKSLTYRRPS